MEPCVEGECHGRVEMDAGQEVRAGLLLRMRGEESPRRKVCAELVAMHERVGRLMRQKKPPAPVVHHGEVAALGNVKVPATTGGPHTAAGKQRLLIRAVRAAWGRTQLQCRAAILRGLIRLQQSRCGDREMPPTPRGTPDEPRRFRHRAHALACGLLRDLEHPLCGLHLRREHRGERLLRVPGAPPTQAPLSPPGARRYPPAAGRARPAA
jgi:hypothetical protein